MVIKPFKGILYNKKKIKNLSAVYAPPYDIISAKQQDEYYKVSPYNVVRLELNKSDNPYTSAARFFNAWREEAILEQDEKPSIYIYGQDFKYKRSPRHTLGFIAAAKIERSRHSKVRPHEMTFRAPKEDREKVLEIVRANLSCIYTLVEDKGLKINRLLRNASKGKPFIDVKLDKVRHRIWKMSAEKEIKILQHLMKDKHVFIADGHHRYEAAANFRDKNNTPAANYIMMYFTSIEGEGLTVLATHRVVREKPRIPDIFKVMPVANKKKMFEALDKYFCGMYADGKFFVLKLKNKTKENLDVSILHSHILNGARDIFYTRDANEAIGLVDTKKYKAAFFLNPTLAAQVRDVSLSGGRMPHKSTYFYPKPLTGLVMRKLEDEEPVIASPNEVRAKQSPSRDCFVAPSGLLAMTRKGENV